jgi:hypothetical protein
MRHQQRSCAPGSNFRARSRSRARSRLMIGHKSRRQGRASVGERAYSAALGTELDTWAGCIFGGERGAMRAVVGRSFAGGRRWEIRARTRRMRDESKASVLCLGGLLGRTQGSGRFGVVIRQRGLHRAVQSGPCRETTRAGACLPRAPCRLTSRGAHRATEAVYSVTLA